MKQCLKLGIWTGYFSGKTEELLYQNKRSKNQLWV